MNIYDGCESNNEIIYSISFNELYEKLDQRQSEILNEGKKVVFVEANHKIICGARVVIYKDKVPQIMQDYKYRYVKINGIWTRYALLGYCDCCGDYTELTCLCERGKVCSICSNSLSSW